MERGKELAGRLWRRYRTLPLWGQIVIGIVVLAVVASPFTGEPDESASELPRNKEESSPVIEETTTTTVEPATTTIAPATTTTATAPPDPEQELRDELLDTLGSSNRDDVERISDVTIGPEGFVLVTWAINEALTEGLTKDNARREATNILQAIREGDVPYTEVTLEGTYALVDQLGNASEERVVLARYPADIVNRINFDNFDFKNVFEVAEGQAFVHPAFRY